MRRPDGKSHCPINYALETFGDPWALLIVRDIVYLGKRTFGEFAASEEGIASGVLAGRLAKLEACGVLGKNVDPADRRRELYVLTDKGVALIPVLLEMANWSAQFDAETTAPPAWIAAVNADKPAMTALVCETVRNGGAIFAGPDSVIEKLQARA